MTKKIYYFKQISTQLPFSEKEIEILHEEGLIEIKFDKQDRYFYEDDLERLEIIKRLKEDLGVNLEGIGVILHMRDKIISMQENFLDFIEEIKKEIEDIKKPIKLKDRDDIIPFE